MPCALNACSKASNGWVTKHSKAVSNIFSHLSRPWVVASTHSTSTGWCHRTAWSRHSTSMHACMQSQTPAYSMSIQYLLIPCHKAGLMSESRPNVTVPTMACYCSLCKAAWLMEAVHWPACSAWWRSARSKPPQPSRPSCTCSRTTPTSLPTCALSKTKQCLG